MDHTTSPYAPTNVYGFLTNMTTNNGSHHHGSSGDIHGTITTVGIVKASFVVLLIMTAIIGNLLVCISFTLFRNLRSVTNYFILSLSIADLLSALLVMPIWCGAQLHNGKWPDFKTQQLLVKYWASTDVFLSAAGVFSLSAISVERNLAITNPFCYTKWLSSNNVFVVIPFLWLVAFGFALVSVSFKPFKGEPLAIFIVAIAYAIPFAVLFIMYAKIYIVAKRQARRLRSDGGFATDLKAMKTITIVVGAYIVCYTPNIVLVVWVHFNLKPKVSLDTITVARWLTYLNSTLNPIIYSCFNKTYRKAFKRLFQNVRKRVRGEEFDNNPKISAPTRTTMQSRTSLNIEMKKVTS